jgi:UDP-N-acetylmuramoylalanine-D-glutamate ligase
MPRLQIVDNKRVVERKQHDAEAAKKAKKAKRKDKAKVKMTGSNAKETTTRLLSTICNLGIVPSAWSLAG